MSDIDALLKAVPFKGAAAGTGDGLDEEDRMIARLNQAFRKMSPISAGIIRARMKARLGWEPPTEEQAAIDKLVGQKKVMELEKEISGYRVAKVRAAMLDNRAVLESKGIDMDAALKDPDMFASVAASMGIPDITPGTLALAQDPDALENPQDAAQARTTSRLSKKAEGQTAAGTLLKTRREVMAGDATNKAGEPVSEFGAFLAGKEKAAGVQPQSDDPIDDAEGAAKLSNLAVEVMQSPLAMAFGGPSETASILMQRQGARVAEQLKGLDTNEAGELKVQGDAGVNDEAVFRLLSWTTIMSVARKQTLAKTFAEMGLKYTGVDEESLGRMAAQLQASGDTKAVAIAQQILGASAGGGP